MWNNKSKSKKVNLNIYKKYLTYIFKLIKLKKTKPLLYIHNLLNNLKNISIKKKWITLYMTLKKKKLHYQLLMDVFTLI